MRSVVDYRRRRIVKAFAFVFEQSDISEHTPPYGLRTVDLKTTRFQTVFDFLIIIVSFFFVFTFEPTTQTCRSYTYIYCCCIVFSVSSLLQTSLDGNVTTSVLTFTPVIKDSDKTLSCRAETSKQENANHRHGKPVDRPPPPADVDSSDGWKMNIFRESLLFSRAFLLYFVSLF